MKLSKSNIFTLMLVALTVAVACVALVACDNETTPPDDLNGGNTQADITTITSLDGILSALGNDYKVSEKVLASAQRKYGSSLAVLKSENADGTGELLVGTDEDGALKVATTSLSLSAGDFTARVFKSGTFTRTGNTLSYYIDNEKQEEDISGAFTKTAENGDLTVVDTSLADEKIDALFENVTLEESGLKTGITNTEKEIFSLVVGNVINEDTEVILPSLTCNYNSMTDKTEVKAVYFLGGKVTICTVSFAGDLTADGFDKEKAQDQIYKETATVTTADKDGSQYDGYSTIYCNTFASMTVEKVPSAQDLEEVITFNSWEEVFTVFGEENSYLIENKLNEIFIEKLLTEENLYPIFGKSITLEDLKDKNKIQFLKWSFTLTDNNITSIGMLVIHYNISGTTANRLRSATFVLNDSLNLNIVSAKKNVLYDKDDKYIINYYDNTNCHYVIDFTDFADDIKTKNDGASYDDFHSYTPADEEGIDIFNLLMPYAVNEKTTYSHVSVSYSSGLENKIKVEISAFNEKSSSYESWTFVVYRGEHVNDDISYSLLETLVKNGNVECYSIANKQMLSGDIIFSLDNDDITYYEINPTAQQ